MSIKIFTLHLYKSDGFLNIVIHVLSIHRYYCTAENNIGSSTTNLTVGVNLSPRLPRHDDLRSCCKSEGVEDDTCLEICTFSLDLDLLAFEVSYYIRKIEDKHL